MTDVEHWLLAPDLTAPRHARRVLREWAARRGTAISDPHTVALVATELVTNAVLHARGPVGLSISIDNQNITLRVTDAGNGHLRPSPGDDGAPTGRGLTIVRALAVDWGVHRRPGGKTVWARVPLG
ncbi:Anti-sigma regulatory factor (Ser/Thr protein kinase) [Pedococcus dokdonensis]|uniref:Anti-sigma regulatory factor (Ser/Thr protein kinase) n=1 Tax=Pedococcus dokdonensis TaxID=443156 RepID=A0A1H0SIE9_9MICO|nr:ATP-binding protein [Pedococcus dokdonensis]SDP40998.1 Anti-sigma regulatory factor (Ser/Thr protein kinase) [Pedococcus dokdonensis]